MQLTAINTIEDVKAFIYYLINHLALNFHPDNCFTDYVTPTGEPVFTEAQAAILEDLLEHAVFVCQELNIDLYEFGLEMFLTKVSGAENGCLVFCEHD